MDRQVAIVTGGMGGIGTAICQRLSRDYQVVSTYFKNGSHDEARLWQDAQRALGFEIDIVYGNIIHYEDCEKLTALVHERFGRIDVLVNNAGITMDVSLKKMTQEQWHVVLDANLNAVFNMTHLVLPYMLERAFGRVISISSINGRKGQFGQCNYAATKAALYGFTKSLALEVATKGITANTISPGYIDTPMLQAVKPEVLQDIIDAIPMGRLGTPDEIASMVRFLASDEAAFITGANFDVNGGQYMG